MSSLPDGWETMGDGVREVRGTIVLRAVFISNGELLNLCTDGKPSSAGVPISIVRYLMRVND